MGAPQALALPGQQANRTGGLFACPLSLEEADCYRVDIDRGGEGCVQPGGGTREQGRGGLGLLFPPLIPRVLPPADVQKESKENQWLGVSVRSQGPGGKIVVSTIFFLTFDIYHFYRKRAGNFVFKKREKQFDSVTVISWRWVPLLVTLCKGVECVFVCMYGVCIHTDVLTELRLAV